MEGLTTEKKSLQQLHEATVKKPQEIREKIINALGAKAKSTYYDVLNGLRKLSPAEKQSIADIYGVPVDHIQWPDQPEPILVP